ncbi:MAG: anti-sigma factor family protein [Thermoanaerobaculia bacterium]
MSRPDERVVAGLTCGEVLAVLSDFLDGELDHGTRQRIFDHLRGCNWCEQFGGRFAYVVESLRRELSDPTPLRADVTARLRERLAKSIDDDQRPGSRT